MAAPTSTSSSSPSLRQLRPGGELIFITPRDFLKATSAVKLNRLLVESGSITDAIELGDARVRRRGAELPDLAFREGRSARAMRYCALGVGDDLAAGLAAPAWEERHLVEAGGHLMFARGDCRCGLAGDGLCRRSARCRRDELVHRRGEWQIATSCARRRSAPGRPGA